MGASINGANEVRTSVKRYQAEPALGSKSYNDPEEAITTSNILAQINQSLAGTWSAITGLEDRIAFSLEPMQSETGKAEGMPIGLSDLNQALLEIKQKIAGQTDRLYGITSRVQL